MSDRLCAKAFHTTTELIPESLRSCPPKPSTAPVSRFSALSRAVTPSSQASRQPVNRSR